MKRKIHFVVSVADRFIREGFINYMDVPDKSGNIIMYSDLLIEYEQIDKDPLVDAYKALRIWVNENHPSMEYRIYYWTLEFI